MKFNEQEKDFESWIQLIAQEDPSQLLSLVKRAPTLQTKGLALAVASCHAPDIIESRSILQEARLCFADNYSGLVLCQAFQAVNEDLFSN